MRSSSCRRFALLVVMVFGVTTTTSAQNSDVAPQLRPFVTVDDETFALTNTRVVDGTGAPAVSDQTILVQNGVIAQFGAAGSVQIPANTRILDLQGKTVLPGFVMMHEHMFYPAGQAAYNQQEYSFPRLYLASGTTTIRTGGSRDPYGDLNLKEAIDAGRVPGPTMHVTAPYLNGPGLPINFVNALEGPEDARRMVNYWADEGATSFKTYMHISRAELRAVVEEAHARGLQVTGHLCSVTYREAADIGIDNLEHGLFASTDFAVGKVPDECPGGQSRTAAILDLDPYGEDARALIRHLVERNVALTSTLTVFETSVPGRPVAFTGALDAMAPDARDRYMRTWARIQGAPSTWPERFQIGMKFEKAFADAGGLLVAGTDPTGYGGVVAGYANQREVELLVEAGFTAAQAIQIATSNGAKLLGIADSVGTIAPGMVADLIVIDGDPTQNIQAIRRVETVFKRGLGFDAERLFQSVKGTVGIR